MFESIGDVVDNIVDLKKFAEIQHDKWADEVREAFDSKDVELYFKNMKVQFYWQGVIDAVSYIRPATK